MHYINWNYCKALCNIHVGFCDMLAYWPNVHMQVRMSLSVCPQMLFWNTAGNNEYVQKQQKAPLHFTGELETLKTLICDLNYAEMAPMYAVMHTVGPTQKPQILGMCMY